VSELRHLDWLANCPIIYWGDIDVEGFEILSALRAVFPHTGSLMMDEQTVQHFLSLGGPGSGRSPLEPPFLAPAERAAFLVCRSKNLRIEQERLPSDFVHQRLAAGQIADLVSD
jgi:hypothetical protein